MSMPIKDGSSMSQADMLLQKSKLEAKDLEGLHAVSSVQVNDLTNQTWKTWL